MRRVAVAMVVLIVACADLGGLGGGAPSDGADGCATAQPDVTVDLTGAPRTAPLSLGANETETCVP